VINDREICVLFSGGSDSTLTAALLADKFKKLHLITCKFSGMFNPSKSTINLERLRKKFSNNEFVYSIIDIEEYFRKYLYENYLKNFFKYGLYIENVCLACKLAMFTGAVKYCLENKLNYIASGANKTSGIVFADQMEENLEVLKKMLQKFSIEYITPTYEIKHSDWTLYDLGITPVKQVKWPSPEAYKEQPGCYFGKMHSIIVHGYFFPFYGKEKFHKLVHRNFLNKLKVVEEMLLRSEK
jgi:tRNA(Ile)-lysidine synthase TilS/MesJ